MGSRYTSDLDAVPGAKMSVDFTTVKGEVAGYSVVLLLSTPFTAETVRVYDAAHGFNEMHRYTRAGGRQNGIVFHDGTLAEGMQVAIDVVKHGHREMIEGWTRR